MISTTSDELNAILRRDFCSFYEKIFNELHPEAIEVGWATEALAYIAQQVAFGDITRAIVNAPPRIGKSLMFSVGLPAYVLCLEPATRIICVSYNEVVAGKNANNCRRVMSTAWYKKLARGLEITKNTETEITTSAGGFRLTTTVGATLSGRGADLIIIDDPLNSNDARSESARTAAHAWYKNVPSRLDDPIDGAIVIVEQRLHVDDLSGDLLRQQPSPWAHYCFPAIGPEDRTIACSKFKTYDWHEGEPLDPVRLPLAHLNDRKREIGADAFNAQYLQAPLLPDGNFLLESYLRYVDLIPPRQSGDLVVWSWDTATKAKDANDFSAGLEFLVRGHNEVYLTKIVRARMDFPTLSSRISEEAQRSSANAVLIEDAGSGSSLIQALRPTLTGVIGIVPKGDKATRMQGGSLLLGGGLLHVKREIPGFEDWLAEYKAFPNGRHDDQMDALSQYLIWHRERPAFEAFWPLGRPTSASSSFDVLLGAPSVEEMLWLLGAG